MTNFKFEFNPVATEKAIATITFNDGSHIDLNIEIRESSIVVWPDVEGYTDYYSSLPTPWAEMGRWAASAIYNTVMAGLGHFGYGLRPSIHGCDQIDHIRTWALAYCACKCPHIA